MLGGYYLGHLFLGESGGSFSEVVDITESEENAPRAVITGDNATVASENTRASGTATAHDSDGHVRTEAPRGNASNAAPSIKTEPFRSSATPPYSPLCDDPVALCDDATELAGFYTDYSYWARGKSKPEIATVSAERVEGRAVMGGQRIKTEAPYSPLCDDTVALCDDATELAGFYTSYSDVPIGGIIKPVMVGTAISSDRPRGVI